MDIREYLQKEQKGFYKIITENLTTERRKQLYDAINDWHKSELKLLGIGGVSQQRELLFDFVAYIAEQNEYVNEVNNNDIDSFLSNNCG